MDNYIEFERRLQRFIDKHYKTLVIKGLVLVSVLLLGVILMVSFLEYYSWFNYSGRLALFIFTLVSAFFIFYYFLLLPILRYFGIFPAITKKKSAEIIAQKMPSLKDYVSNILELKGLNEDKFDKELVAASINQKIEFTKGYNFQELISYKTIVPLLKYLVSLIIIYSFLFFLKPGIIIEGSNRIIHFNQTFQKDLGYTLQVNNEKLIVEQGKDLEFDVFIKGDILPTYISYYLGSDEYLMEKTSNRAYHGTIKNINKGFSFRVGNDEYKTELLTVKVIKLPLLKNFQVGLTYPKYINKTSENLTNVSNLKVPNGTHIQWKLECVNTKDIFMVYNKDTNFFKGADNMFVSEQRIFKSGFYSVYGSNTNLEKELIPKSFITVIPDLFPEIAIKQIFDSNNSRVVHFKGTISDDYGFTSLAFVINNREFKVPFNINLNQQEFYFSYEFMRSEEDAFNYYFEVYDNDKLNGYKSTRSNSFYFKIPSYEELAEFKSKQEKEIIEKMEKSMLLAEEFKRDIEDMKQKLFSENLSSFEKEQLLESLQNKQNTLEQLMNELAKQNLDKNVELDSFNEKNEELLNKQQEIQNLLEQIMDEDLKALLEELAKLSKELNKEELKKSLDKLDMNYDKIADQLDKNLELLKKFEIEKDLSQVADQLEKVSKEQEQLAEKMHMNEDSVTNKNMERVSELKEQFSKALEKNELLEKPLQLNDKEEDFNELMEGLQESLDSNEQGEEKPDSKKEKKQQQKENSEKAKKLADDINMMLNNNRSTEDGENADALRQILENLIYFSFKQEEISAGFQGLASNSPQFMENIKQQNNIASNFAIIKDSLNALSKRTPYLGNHISKKVFSIQTELYDINALLDDRNVTKGILHQRMAMQNANDLILLLSESLKNFDSSMGSGGGESKKKNKPKQSKPSLSDMRKSQESMKSELESLIKQMKEGKGKDGKLPSEKLGKYLAQQEIMEQMMNQLQNSGAAGKEFSKQLDEIRKLMEQNKRDVIHQQIDQRTLNRQNQIVTRMLEAEKAEMEREIDEQRKSNEATNYTISQPEILFKEENKKIDFNDVINKSTLKLNYFYKNKYQEYIKNLN